MAIDSEKLTPSKISEIVDAYIEMFGDPNFCERDAEERLDYPLFWAYLKIADLLREDPEQAWPIILEIASKTDDPKVLEVLSAGELEDLLAFHGEDFIDRIEVEAASNKKFRLLLAGVWKNAMSDAVWERVLKASPEGEEPMN